MAEAGNSIVLIAGITRLYTEVDEKLKPQRTRRNTANAFRFLFLCETLCPPVVQV